MPEFDPRSRASAFLIEEMEAAHSAFLRMRDGIDKLVYVDTIFTTRWAAAARLMTAQVAVANALNRLAGPRPDGNSADLRQGPSSRQNGKTNVPLRPALMDEQGGSDAAPLDRP